MRLSPQSIPDSLVAAGVNLGLEALAVEVTELLADGAVRALFLKGSSLHGWIYPAGATRFSSDVDILVAPDAFARAEAILARADFEPQVHWRDDRTARHWRRRDAFFEIDLHRTIVGVGVSPERLWLTISAYTEPLTVRSGTLEMLTPPARCLLLGLHAAKHQDARGAPLEDLERGLECLPQTLWREAAVLGARLEAVPAFAAGLRLSPAGAAVADALCLPVGTTPEVALFRGRTAGSVALNRLLEQPGARAKARFAFRRAFPDPATLRQMDPLARRGPAGLAAAYARRCGWLLVNAVPATVAVARARRDARR